MLFDDLYELATRNVTVERSALAIRFGLYALFVLLLLPVTLPFDCAKIRTVVEDRRTMIGSIIAAARFMRRHLRTVVGLYLPNGCILVAVLAAYAALVPRLDAPLWLTFVVGQAYLVARVSAKLVFYASHVAYFQSQLAHATYVAMARPAWPESPASEAITGPTDQH